MKSVALCFILIGFWSVMSLEQGEAFEYECDILQRLDYLGNTNKETKQFLVSQEVMLNTANTLIAAQESKIAVLERKDKEKDQLLASLTNKVAKLEGSNKTSTEKLQDQSVGFTMKIPKASSKSGQLIFSAPVSNVGGGYNVTTGVFTCSIPGYYYFSASLYKEYSYDGLVSCYIYKNRSYLVTAQTQPGNIPRTGTFAAVNSVYVHLDAGDNVELTGRSPIASFKRVSTFSGFLVTADVI